MPISACMALNLRAAERTFQLMRQVAGRAGRADKPGQALLQTFQPEHPVIRAILSGDEEGFWKLRPQGDRRRVSSLRPYGRVLSCRVLKSGRCLTLANAMARNDVSLRKIGAQVLVRPRPRSRVFVGRHRVRLLVKAPKGASIQNAIVRWIAPLRLKGDIRLTVDIDPQSFY